MGALDTILDFLVNASPLVGLIGAIVVLVFAFFKHRETMRQLRGFSDMQSLMSEVKSMLSTHVAISDNRMSTLHGSAQAEIDCLREIHKELIKLTSLQNDGFVTTSDAKLMIHYQWSWCRDETARLICNSIKNNNFRKNEELIARKVQRAWKKAADNSRQSLKNLKGLKYPFDMLFERHICMLWEYAWNWAIPLYHRDLGSATLDEALSDLNARIYALFDDTIEAYFESIEDIDSGSLYKTEELRSSGEFVYSEDDITPTAKMAADLRHYERGSSTDSADQGTSTRINVRAEMERRTTHLDRSGEDESLGDSPALEGRS